jgi:hypothetical protein
VHEEHLQRLFHLSIKRSQLFLPRSRAQDRQVRPRRLTVTVPGVSVMDADRTEIMRSLSSSVSISMISDSSRPLMIRRSSGYRNVDLADQVQEKNDQPERRKIIVGIVSCS